MTDKDTKPEEPHWLVRPSTIRLLRRGGIGLLALTVLADLLVEPYPYFGIDGSFGFYAWYGFIACVAMIVGAKALGLLLSRKDSYYD